SLDSSTPGPRSLRETDITRPDGKSNRTSPLVWPVDTKRRALHLKEEPMKISSLAGRRAARALALPAILLALLLPAPAAASRHRAGAGISKYPLWDNTDVYAFRDPIVTDQLTIISNWIPLEDPSGFPNFFHFDENAWYQIHIDNDGDGIE